jgi:hypothetical protein
MMMNEQWGGSSYKITLIETNDNFEILKDIYNYLDAIIESENRGAAWFREYYVNGICGVEATKIINERNDITQSRFLYVDNFSRIIRDGVLGRAATNAIKANYYPEAIYMNDYRKPKLKLGDVGIDVKIRPSAHKKSPLFFARNCNYLPAYLSSGGVYVLVIVYYSIMQCIVERWKIEYDLGE